MTTLRYHDVWDTVRTGTAQGIAPTGDAHAVASGTLLYSLLLGENPVFSQTEAFDSALLLAAAAALAGEGTNFKWLLEKAAIRVHLFDAQDVKTAFIAALERPDFVFSAWPEIEEGTVERAAIIEAIGGGAPGLPDPVKWRVESLLGLDSAASAGLKVHGGRAGRASVNMPDLLDRVVFSAIDAGHRLAPALTDLSSRHLTARSPLYSVIREEIAPEDQRRQEELRSIVDACYNKVIASSLQADQVGLSTSHSGLLGQLLAIDDSAVEHETSLTDLVPGLASVSWTSVRDLLEESERKPYSRVEQLAIHKEFLARALVDGHPFLAIAPDVANRLLAVALLGVAGAAAWPVGPGIFLAAVVGSLSGFALPPSVKEQDIVRKAAIANRRRLLEGTDTAWTRGGL